MTDPARQHRAVTMPDKPSIDGLEDKWARVWAEQGTYTFDRNKTRDSTRSCAQHGWLAFQQPLGC